MSDFKVIYYKSFNNTKTMKIAEDMILDKLREYKNKANIDRFILPFNKKITLLTDVFDKVYDIHIISPNLPFFFLKIIIIFISRILNIN